MRSSRPFPPAPDDPDSLLDQPFGAPHDAVPDDRFITIEAFGHRFEDVLASRATDLITLEREQAIYAEFWSDDTETFRHVRIPLTAGEVVTYVEAELAMQEFDRALADKPGVTLREALASLSSPVIAQRVIDYGISDLRDGTRLDIRGCPASFLPAELEDLLCGQRPERYEYLPRLGNDRDQVALIASILQSAKVLGRHLNNRRAGKAPFLIEDEYDVQDLAFVGLRAVFPRTHREDWAPAIAGSSKKIDVIVPEAHAVVEVKFVRDSAHAKRVSDELKIDIESYHSHPDCQQLFAMIYDPGGFIVDPEPLITDLSGYRVKGPHTFTVHVLVV